MAGTLGVTETTRTEISQLRANEFCHSTEVHLAAAAGAVERGMIMGQITATGHYVPLDIDAADGSEVARGILDIIADETITGISHRRMFFAGSYRMADLVWPAGITEPPLKARQELSDAGIILV
jgi:hypothetical protein